MQVGVLGVNYKSAGLRLRESLAKACQRKFAPDASAHSDHAFVLLSTCNRTEVYFSSQDLAATHSYLLNVLRHEVCEEFEHKLYSYFGVDCFSHLCRVTAGMDSAILAETEIQGQVKNAYELSRNFVKLPYDLHFLFQKSLKIGKEIRSAFPITKMPSFEDAIIQLGSMIFNDFKKKKTLVVGLSEINSRILLSLKANNFKNLWLCNRTDKKAEELTAREGLHFLPWKQLYSWHQYDLVLFGTKSSNYLIGSNDLPSSANGRKLILDLCVPRNVKPSLGKHPLITLLNIDQINHQVEKLRKLKGIEVERVESFLKEKSIKTNAVFCAKGEARLSFAAQSKAAVLGF